MKKLIRNLKEQNISECNDALAPKLTTSSSFPRRRESRSPAAKWIPALQKIAPSIFCTSTILGGRAGMTENQRLPRNLMKHAIVAIALFSLTAFSTVSAATDVMPEVKSIQQEWAKLNYSEGGYKQLQTLAKRANKLSTDNPSSAEALVWDAIVLSTLASKKGGIGALSLVTEAKTKLEKAETIDPTVLNGSVYTSLATLYSKVPGWPIGFGNDKKARQYFQKALKANPNGLDINFFYAEYLADKDQDKLALHYLDKALNAPTLEGRPVADKGRRDQAKKLKELLTSRS